MIDIIPNWHPLFVHFTIVFVLVLAAVQLLKWFAPTPYNKLVTPSAHHLLVAVTFLSVVATVSAGFFAYNSVAHDTPSHLAMTNHKNWALVTAAIISIGAVFYFVLPKFKSGLAGNLFVAAAVLVLVTGFKGGELVYRYGLGVMSLPSSDEHGHSGGESHNHSHAESEAKGSTSSQSKSQNMPHNDMPTSSMHSQSESHEHGEENSHKMDATQNTEHQHTHENGETHSH